ncbi:MAG: hypothetical protein NXH97_23370 [Rhodobacteraceae bacterium]|nr:hypothetical protein [Paracoccaceae bacterium]
MSAPSSASNPAPNPFLVPVNGQVETFALGLEMMHLAGETQSIMVMRLLGLSGLWNVQDTESARMVAEKPAAFARSAEAAIKAAMVGGRPDQVMAAAVEPLRSKTRANVARLSRRGPGLPL